MKEVQIKDHILPVAVLQGHVRLFHFVIIAGKTRVILCITVY